MCAIRQDWELNLGATPLPEGGVSFCVWAPECEEMAVKLIDGPRCLMEKRGEYHYAICKVAAAGSHYLYCFGGSHQRPDPVSRWQPEGVHGPSRVVDPAAYQWSDVGWQGISLQDAVLYELHVGTFTPEGTFEAIIAKLSYLKDLGITAISLMPVGQFPGERNWGYDAAYPYAVHHSYGGPEGLKRLVDACHQAGLAVVLDVVYNHLGPEGNYLADFAPYFTDHYKTPWGCAVNYDGRYSDGVRRYFIDNARHWISEYHIDGLRLDAIHAIFDFGARHILAELKEAVAALNPRVWVIAESDLNDVQVLNPPAEGGYGLNAQWHDDFHHAVHTALTGQKQSYFVDFGSLEGVRKAIEEGFVIDGCYSQFRKRHHGSSTRRRPGQQFVTFIQNHDQIANACQGQRLGQELSFEGQKLAAALSILGPMIPMLFMGEEWGASSPFYYFTSFGDEQLAASVREGRMRESVGEAVDPQAETTFERCQLLWDEIDAPRHQMMLACYRDLFRCRRSTPALRDCRKEFARVHCHEAERWLVLWRSGDAVLVANFDCEQQMVAVPFPPGRWRPTFSTFDLQYGGELAAPKKPIVSDDDTPIQLVLPGFGATLYLRN